MELKFEMFNCKVKFGRYENGNKRIQLTDIEDFYPVTTASINTEEVLEEI